MIKLTSYADGHVEFHIDDVRYLPDVLRDLASMGYDLSKCRKALDEIEEERRKRLEREERIRAIDDAVKMELDEMSTERRGVVAWLDDKGTVQKRRGTGFSDGRIVLDYGFPLPDRFENERDLEAIIRKLYPNTPAVRFGVQRKRSRVDA